MSAPFGMPHRAVPSGGASSRRPFSETPPAAPCRFFRLGPLIGQQGGELRLHLAPLLPFRIEPVPEVVNHPVLVGYSLGCGFKFCSKFTNFCCCVCVYW